MAKTTSKQPAIDYSKLNHLLLSAQDDDQQLFHQIVNAPFTYRVETAFLFLGIVVLLLINEETGMIDRVALSETELARNTTDVSYVPFNEIKIPVDDTQNIVAKAVQTGEAQDTTDWKYLFTPALTAEQARINQASGGIAYSAVWPLKARSGGAMIFSYYQYQGEIGVMQHEFMQHYSLLADTALKSR
jgi:hypothetical protein